MEIGINEANDYLLFDLYDDPEEHHYVSSQYPEKIQGIFLKYFISNGSTSSSSRDKYPRINKANSLC